MPSLHEDMRYETVFGVNGESLKQTPHYFHVTISEGLSLWGDALGLAENVKTSMDPLFYSRNGDNLGLTVQEVGKFGASAVTWKDTKTNETRLLMMTDGYNIVVPDPSFLPIGDQCCNDASGINIGIQGHDDLSSYQKSMPWVNAVLTKLGMNNGKTAEPLTIEEMAGHMRRKINEAQIKNRRSHF